MRKINKIYIIILVLILCSACGRPHGLSAKTGRDVNCESELGNFSKYINLEKLSTTTDDTCKGQEVKVDYKKVEDVCETEKAFYIYMSSVQAIIIPKRVLDQDKEKKLRQILSKK